MLQVDDAIAIAEHEWRAMGVVARDRARLADDLRVELTGALAEGATIEQLLGPDIRTFARRLADEAGARRLPYEVGLILRTGLIGAAPGLLYGWAMIWWVPWLGESVLALVATRYLLPALLVLGGAFFAIRTRLRGLPAIDRTVRAMALLVPPVSLLAVPITMAFAALTGYSTALPVLIAEVGIVAGLLSGATLAARWWALRPMLSAAPAQGRFS